jgi:hypothetical protein
LILLQCIKEPKSSLLILSYSGLWSLATFALFSGPWKIYGAPQLSGATDGVVGVVANLLQCLTKLQLEPHMEAAGDALTLVGHRHSIVGHRHSIVGHRPC